METQKTRVQRGRPPSRSRLQIILERRFVEDFAAREVQTNRTSTHFFGWVARVFEGDQRPDERRERLIRDFSKAKIVGRRTWQKSIEWYCRSMGGDR